MSNDTTLYRAPQSYPEPPGDMYYEVPKDKPLVYERPKPIFPWEVNQRRPSRVFPDEQPLPPVPDPNHQPAPMPTLDTSGGTDAEASRSTSESTPEMILASVASGGIINEAFASYARTNVWDDDPAIQTYMNALQARSRRRRSPPSSIGSSPQFTEGTGTRPSLILTDFPTEMERPSLPVTPAPMAGNSLWGSDQPVREILPAAKGVPTQAAWNPISRLEELEKRQSEVFLAGPSASRSLSSREQISSTIPSTAQGDAENSKVSPQPTTVSLLVPASIFPGVESEHQTTTGVDESIISMAGLTIQALI